MGIRIINKHTYQGRYIYCGRGSALGNRYSHLPNTQAEFKVGTREEAISLGVQDIYNRLVSGERPLVEMISQLIVSYNKGEEIILGCYCFPLPCHLDLIKQGIENEEFIMIPHVEQCVIRLGGMQSCH